MREPFLAHFLALGFGHLLARVHLGSFALNSTVGLLGFRDVATKRGLPDTDEDFGRTFRAWGWERADYLVVPAIGSYTTRDFLGWGLGLGVDALHGVRQVAHQLDRHEVVRRPVHRHHRHVPVQRDRHMVAESHFHRLVPRRFRAATHLWTSVGPS